MTIEKNVDCYGWMYNERLVPCRDRCAVRNECKALCKSRMTAIGPKKFEQRQKSIILANEEELRQDALMNKYVATDSQSSLVLEVIEFCNSMGLKGINRDSYITFKHNGRTLFKISRVKSTKVYGLIRFVNVKEYKEFPAEVIAGVSDKPCQSGYYFSIVETMDELKTLLANYIKIFKEAWSE